jgi:hypothetical protein
MTTITRDEWMAEFERVMHAQRPGDPGLSSYELAQQMRITPARVNDLLRKVAESGRLRCGRKPHIAIDGRHTMVPCYTTLPSAGVKRAAKRR